MFTTCPKCSLKLVVTAADLRVAQGFVRCGRCADIFNALAGLTDEQQAQLALESAATPAVAAPERPAPDRAATDHPVPQTESRPPSHPPSAPAKREDEPIPDSALEFDVTATDVSEVFVERAPDDGPTGTFESIILGGEDVPPEELLAETHELELDHGELEAPPPGESVTSPPPDAPPPATAAQHAPIARDITGAAHTPIPPSPEPPRAAAPPPPAATARAAAPAAAPFGRAAAPAAAPFGRERGERSARATRLTRWGFGVGSSVLAVVLLAQIVNHERSELADIEWLRPPLAAVYFTLGIALVPHWNVGAYEVRQLGAVAGQENPGALTVRASIKNTAPRQQPLPLLRVIVQDRFGNRIAARDVPPSAYLPAADARRTELGAGQRVDADIAFVDPGPNAVGFEIDACLATPSGRIACANDAGAQR